MLTQYLLKVEKCDGQDKNNKTEWKCHQQSNVSHTVRPPGISSSWKTKKQMLFNPFHTRKQYNIEYFQYHLLSVFPSLSLESFQKLFELVGKAMAIFLARNKCLLFLSIRSCYRILHPEITKSTHTHKTKYWNICVPISEVGAGVGSNKVRFKCSLHLSLS